MTHATDVCFPIETPAGWLPISRNAIWLVGERGILAEGFTFGPGQSSTFAVSARLSVIFNSPPADFKTTLELERCVIRALFAKLAHRAGQREDDRAEALAECEMHERRRAKPPARQEAA